MTEIAAALIVGFILGAGFIAAYFVITRAQSIKVEEKPVFSVIPPIKLFEWEHKAWCASLDRGPATPNGLAQYSCDCGFAYRVKMAKEMRGI